jgi:hypothetical protein
MKLYYTPQLRKYDIGVLSLGSTQISIPGNNPNVTTLPENICPSSCTSKLSNNITVISSMLHMHTLGLNITTRHVRQGKELAKLGEIQYYDFGHQKQLLVTDPQTRIIAPGDSLRTTCTYLPTLGNRSNTTKFGEETTDEMCFNFVFYYPKSETISQCIQQPFQLNSTFWAICATQSEISKMRQYVQYLRSNDSEWKGLDPITSSLKVANLLREKGLIAPLDESENKFDVYNPVCLKSQKSRSIASEVYSTFPVTSIQTATALRSESTRLHVSCMSGFLLGFMVVVLVLLS